MPRSRVSPGTQKGTDECSDHRGFYLCTLKKDATLLRTPQKLVVTYMPSLELFFSLTPFRRHSVRFWPFGGSDMWDRARKISSLPSGSLTYWAASPSVSPEPLSLSLSPFSFLTLSPERGRTRRRTLAAADLETAAVGVGGPPSKS